MCCMFNSMEQLSEYIYPHIFTYAVYILTKCCYNQQRWQWNNRMEWVLGPDDKTTQGGHTGWKVDIFLRSFSYLPKSSHIFSYMPISPHICWYLLIMLISFLLSWYLPESKAWGTHLKQWTPTRTALSLSTSSSSWWPSDHLTFTFSSTKSIFFGKKRMNADLSLSIWV